MANTLYKMIIFSGNTFYIMIIFSGNKLNKIVIFYKIIIINCNKLYCVSIDMLPTADYCVITLSLTTIICSSEMFLCNTCTHNMLTVY